MILGVEIENFDVFDKDLAGILIEESVQIAKDKDQAVHNRLRNLDALVGRNSTGKTSFMGCLSFLQDVITDGCAEASISKGRPGFANMSPDISKPSVFRVFFKIEDAQTHKPKYIQYEIGIATSIYKSPYICFEKVLTTVIDGDEIKIVTMLDIKEGRGEIVYSSPLEGQTGEVIVDDEHLPALSLYGKLTRYSNFVELFREIRNWFFCSFSSEEQSSYFHDGGAPGGHKHLNSMGSNVGNVLEYMKMKDEEAYEKIVTEIKSKIPTMKHKKNLPEVLKESPDKLFLYLLLLRDGAPRSTIFIETPDKDLYHDMVDVLADEMRSYTLKNSYCQIIFSTHNPYIIETLSPKEVWIFERTFEKENGDVTIRCAGDDPLVTEMFKQGVGMGAIWYAGHLDSDQE
ncbi:MAG: ATP-binding protein [Clostridiales bacterium]|nr:ATP-binding protein [Clostridiales bacterium]